MDLFEALYERRSSRTFNRGEKLPGETVEKILDSAFYAPRTPDGIHPWKLLVVRDEEIKALTADFAQEIARAGFGGSFEIFDQHLWYMPPSTRLRVAEYTMTGSLWRYPEDADLMVVPCVNRSGWGAGFSTLLNTTELVSPYAGFCSQNMWLVAHSLGVGAGYNMMPMVDVRRREILQQKLGVPHSWDVAGAFSFGYSSVARHGPSRGPEEAIVHKEYWGNYWERAVFRQVSQVKEWPHVDLIETIKSAKPSKSFKPGHIEDELIERILDTAIWGPNPENVKCWRFIVVRDQKSKDFIQQAAGQIAHQPWYWTNAEAQYARSWFVSQDPVDRLAYLEQKLAKGFGSWYAEADACVIVLSAGWNWIEQPYMPQFIAGGNPAFPLATGCSVQNAVLAATGLGLGWNFDPTPIYDDRTREVFYDFFGIPKSWVALGVLSLGCPGEYQEEPPKPTPESMIFNEYWGNPYP